MLLMNLDISIYLSRFINFNMNLRNARMTYIWNGGSNSQFSLHYWYSGTNQGASLCLYLQALRGTHGVAGVRADGVLVLSSTPVDTSPVADGALCARSVCVCVVSLAWPWRLSSVCGARWLDHDGSAFVRKDLNELAKQIL